MTASCPPIVVYAAIAHSDATPEHMKYAAAMVPRKVPARGKVPAHTEAGTSWLCTAATPEEARAKLEALWDKAYPPPSKRGAHLRKPATVSDVPNADDDAALIVV